MLVAITLLAAGCATRKWEIGPTARLILWTGSGRVSMATVQSGRAEVAEHSILITPPAKYLNYASAAASRLAFVGRRAESDIWSIFVIDVKSGRVEAEIPNVVRGVGLSPEGRRVVYTASSPQGRHLALILSNFETLTSRVLVPGPVGSPRSLSWHPSGEAVAYDGVDGWIYSVRIADGHTSRLVEGTTPAWSPDGSQLTFRRDQTVYLFEPATGSSMALHARRSWQSGLNVGFPSWTPDSRYVTWNAEMLYDHDCLLIDITTGKVRSLYEGSSFCGPWVKLD